MKYLDAKTTDINFKEKWQFIEYPSFWSRNRGWLLLASAGLVGGISTNLLSPTKETKKEPLDAHPIFPEKQ